MVTRYQRLGKAVSFLGVLANIFTLALGPHLLGVAIFATCALFQALAVVGYRMVAKARFSGLVFIWLGVGAHILSGLFGFFAATGIVFLALFILALVSAIGTTISLQLSKTNKVIIISGGIIGIFIFIYLIVAVAFRAFS